MTLLAKILVFVTLVLSLLMFTWALALYTNRIDWSARAPKADQAAGALQVRQKRLDEVEQPRLALAATRWRESLKGNGGRDNRPVSQGLLAWEQRRVADRKWYGEELQAARSGAGGNADNKAPIKRVATKDGQLILDAGGRPTLADAERRKDDKDPRPQPLYSYDYYVRELADRTQKIQDAQAKYQAKVKEAENLTAEAIGPKGLRQRIVDEEIKIGLLDEELKDVIDRQTNSQVDTDLLLARRRQLELRKAELEKARQAK
jgi:hypothetical protein